MEAQTKWVIFLLRMSTCMIDNDVFRNELASARVPGRGLFELSAPLFQPQTDRICTGKGQAIGGNVCIWYSCSERANEEWRCLYI